ncbi:unnamed protein product, partial [Callosobruchus maculatus]
MGNPYEGCRPECVLSSDCPTNKACMRNKCGDPCPGVCGKNAECAVINHVPTCTCLPGHVGDPFGRCVPALPPPTEKTAVDPCSPTPCGPYSQCRNVNDQAVCSCLPEYTGTPPNCKPECVVSSECPQNRACHKFKCANPCAGTCGLGARCEVINHNPICSCPERMTGDPFTRCHEIPPPPTRTETRPIDPCRPSPCGPNSECRAVGDQPSCSCKANFVGSPPNCRPECVVNTDCSSSLACITEKCRDPCPGSCGFNAECRVQNHIPVCTCQSGFTGDAFTECSRIPPPKPEAKPNPCDPSPCGQNAQCRDGICSCLPEYQGDPYQGCRPECTMNTDCSPTKACINLHCVDPCPGTCGQNALCDIVNHIPTCSCPQGHEGDPFTLCRPKRPEPPLNPCQPSPCGPNSACRVNNGVAVCSCLPGLVGSPPSCRPECVVSAECALTQACLNNKCVDPCPGTCGVAAKCQVVNHNPICSCDSGHTGDPFTRCYPIPKVSPPPTPADPCRPSPCGPNAACRVVKGSPACSCLEPYVGAPPNCRPECTISPECPPTKACLNQRCRDPCPGSCGQNALCTVINHGAVCSCSPGHTGDPFRGCIPTPARLPIEEVRNPCVPSPCGTNAICKERNGAGSCTCLPEYIGNPYEGCKPECVRNSDCPANKACMNNKCIDPCPGTCGTNSICQVINHAPSCICAPGLTGDPFRHCSQPRPEPVEAPKNPCDPTPCGPNSQCKEVNNQAVCSCLPNYIGSPPGCRPECVVSMECAPNKACVSQKCVDPCPGTCGLNSKCQVVNHSPICSCRTSYTGDPFTRCYPIPPPPPVTEVIRRPQPCVPSPCGPNSQCKAINDSPSCSCLPEFIGTPPNCRPECIINSECPSNLACINKKCKDPCPGSCGISAECKVLNHNAICTCPVGFEGDPFNSCHPKPVEVQPVEVKDPCRPSPCGTNARCDNGICTCLPEYQGDPYQGCRPECMVNNDCPRDRSCIRNKCVNPCPGTCAPTAICQVVNHIPMCSCPPAYTGNAFVACRAVEAPPKRNPCNPSPCGPNSQCREVNEQAVCSCVPGFLGSPPTCRPECITSSECPLTQTCINQKCVDPCPGTCGLSAKCQVVNHNPICSCPVNYDGDPFIRCTPKPPEVTAVAQLDPCQPSPCGPNSQCKAVGNSPSCSCLPEYQGSPPNCRPECRSNSECPFNLACINQKCKDPCPGSCGQNAECRVVSHTPNCVCNIGFEGDPFTQCVPVRQPAVQELRNPCEPSPCGANAICKERNGAGSCVCLPEYIGNPYEGCRPECVINSDCPSNKACIRNKCLDPCPGTCGQNANCQVINHLPSCTCLPGYTGDPFRFCSVVIEPAKIEPKNPCQPSPCGPNSQCREVNGQAVCSCLPNYIGSPPGCRPECTVSSECASDKACINQRCSDPCPGSCGLKTACQVVNHSPICSCHPGFTGDPFTSCFPIPAPPPAPIAPISINPCVPSPCGPNSQCRDIGGAPSCSCLETYLGSPPNCRPECIINSECPSNMACINQKCRDPCPGSCGSGAQSSVINHTPICSCPEGYTGDPFSYCQVKPAVFEPVETDPCNPSPCGPNAQCNDGVCTCLPEYQGDPYRECRPECVLNTDCPKNRACVRNKCQDPCPGTCGTNAVCSVINHIPMCSCIQGYVGNAFVMCNPIPAEIPKNPCNPTPCGPNSQCREINGQAVCSCVPGYLGSPPTCRPECATSTECSLNQACVNQKCIDPCPGTCGLSAVCQVVNHNPVCSCPPRFTGDPLTRCLPMPEPVEETPTHPCEPSPCGPNSQCKEINGSPSCSCLSEFTGSPPNCKPECISNSECPNHLACINQKCKDPCPGICGQNAECRVVSHTPNCVCQSGYFGDPFTLCSVQQTAVQEILNPCQPSPCGVNAICKERNGAGSCVCLPEYIGNPYEGCRPECSINSDCPSIKACVRNKCVDPCPGTCGQNADCQVINHLPSCTCIPGYTGDPFRFCSPEPQPVQEESPKNPCQPNPCGPNSQCREINGQAVCSCVPGFIGSPPTCRPECVTSSECPLNQACVNQKCIDPCPGTCGLRAKCQVVNHNPICSCPPKYSGDPFTRCVPIEKRPEPTPPRPCEPSPCGPNSQCKDINGSPSCSCLPAFIGSPPNCKPECISNSECPIHLACINQKCKDPCPGICGQNAECKVVSHTPNCVCLPGFIGDPFVTCQVPTPVKQEVAHPCLPSPCGANAICKELNGAGSCTCLPEYIGNPYEGCRPECTLNSDCPSNKACIRNKCVDPCPGTCGQNAECQVINHLPSCTCIPGYTGDPFRFCNLQQPVVPEEPKNPCQPSPCGPNSQCREVNGQAVCSCLPNYIGSPPGCRPECTVSSECAQDKACINQKCSDPCPGTCGLNANCQVINHSPICSCKAQFTGDPFTRCFPIPPPLKEPVKIQNPCVPSPCGPNSICQDVNGVPSCSCVANYIGTPPNCRPECTINSDCPSNLACINQKCKDPCPGSCGSNAQCSVINHTPICSCIEGYIGDPFSYCKIKPVEVKPVEADPCNPSPCGANARCSNGVCSCLPEYQGNPYEGCRPECVLNSDCSRNLACINSKCKDPCPGTCGQNAQCAVINHIPTCTCNEGYQGNALVVCSPIPAEAPKNPCNPSPCGPNSQCREINGQSVCSCVPGFIGSPPTCRPECVTSTECPLNQACVNQKCIDPCPGTCGINARCQVVNHNPICSCPDRYTGDPFLRCLPALPEPAPVPTNPCQPSPCGPNSQCKEVNGAPSCSCLPEFLGSPPNCKPECISNSECPSHQACINQKCKDPCPGVCGQNAECRVVAHTPNCACLQGFSGNPFQQCLEIQAPRPAEQIDPCFPSPCGANAICKERNNAGSCVCIPEYIGNPYEGCRPECVLNSDCPSNKACINNKCKDPCPGTCGQFAECHVINHLPSCTCVPGYTGDPFVYCNAVQVKEPTPVQPCNPSPCGPNSQCREVNSQAVCSCLPNYIGSPPACRPECTVSSECSQEKACINQKCADPCPGTCGLNAKCQVINHSPICSCSVGNTGDPFTRCYNIPPPPKEPPTPVITDPCIPSPCGPNSQCRNVGNNPSCSCLPNYIGNPPNCKPECTINSECPSNLACINEKCKDPCPGSCGIGAICEVRNHNPNCACPPQYSGDAFVSCVYVPPQPPAPKDPCNPNPCGPNAKCNDGTCTCLPDYQGDPYRECRPECVLNSDCPRDKACINRKCKDPCPGICGQNAECAVFNHVPSCNCLQGYSGNPFVFCSKVEAPPPTNPCSPTPCGPNSQCREFNGQAVCSCLQGYIGSPPTCRPECVTSSECSLNLACVNQKCVDPCPGTCGLNALCQVVKHNPICSCPARFTGDPFVNCRVEIVKEPTLLPEPKDPCVPSPCGPNAQCEPTQGGTAKCSCLESYVGSPPNCRPECVSNSDCSKNLACVNLKCKDPCPGSCGLNSRCLVVNHVPNCVCLDSFVGDPFTMCHRPTPPPPKPTPREPCSPSPCGANAICRVENQVAVCQCLPEYRGNPYESCRPECLSNSECPGDRACIRNKCQDPCPGTCGINAECLTRNHVPVCTCLRGYQGDAFRVCSRVIG